MNTNTRKQQEIQERERRILDVALAMFNQHGYHGLSMDKIAEQLRYSKGTIYNHFGCKEEIIIALAIETTNVLQSLFQRAVEYPGNSRERVTAIGVAFELFVMLHPAHFLVMQILRSDSIWQKTSDERRAVIRGCELRSMSIVAGVVRDGIAHKELTLPEGRTAEDIVFGLWSLNYGGYSIITTSPALNELGLSNPVHVVRQQCDALLDGIDWNPASDAHDYDETRKCVAETLFAKELADADHQIP